MALVLGTNCGLVLTAPTEDPAEGNNFTIDRYTRAVKVTVGVFPIKVTEIGWWCDNATEAANFEVGVYSHHAGTDKPDVLLEVDRTNAKGTTAGWKKCSGLSWNLSANTIYWLAIQLDNTSTTTQINYASIGGQRHAYKASQTTLQDPLFGPAAGDNIIPAIYGLYENGEVNKNTFWVDNSGTWVDFSKYYEYFKIKKRQNQVNEFEIKVFDISTAQKAYFKEGAEVLFFAGTYMVLKGKIQKIEYATGFEVIASGIGMEVLLLNKEFIKSGDNRIQYTNESAQTVVTEINSDILTTHSSGIFDTDYGDVSLRFEYANRLNCLGKTAETLDYYWWVSQTSSDDYDADYLHFDSNQGETSSQKTFDLTSSCHKTSQEKDINSLVNYVHALGYGDGINQLSTSCYAASTQSSLLNSNIASTNTSVLVVDGSDFDATGSARMADEIIDYAGIDSNTLTGCTRGVGTTARAHNKNCYIEQHFATDSAQTGSSIQVYGLMDKTLIDKTIVDRETLEVISSRYLLDRKTPIIRIKIESDEPITDAALNIGDNVTVTDSEADISGNYRIVGQEFESNYGFLKLTTEVSNRSLEFIEQMNKAREDALAMAKYMQGSTNIYALTETENLDVAHPLNMRFYLPSEAIAVNEVLLNFQLKDFRSDNYEEETKYWTAQGTCFHARDPDTAQVRRISGVLWMEGSNIACYTPVYLPDGAIVTGAIVYGSISDEFWNLERTTLAVGSAPSLMAQANFNTEDTSIKRNPIDNTNYAYYISTSGLDINDKIYGARIKYTLGKEGISEETLSNPEVVVSAGVEDSETIVGTYSSAQTDLDITSQISSVGTDAWANIKFEGGGGTKEDEIQDSTSANLTCYTGYPKHAQKKTLSNQKVHSLSFNLKKSIATGIGEYYNTDDDIDGDLYDKYWWTQTFTIGTVSPEEDFPLSSVKLKVWKEGSPGTVTLDIKGVGGDHKPTGSALSSGSFNANNLTATSSPGEWKEVSMSSYTLSDGTEYGLVIHLNGDVDNELWARLDDDGENYYLGGKFMYSGNTGSTWTLNDNTLMFEILGEEGTDPTGDIIYNLRKVSNEALLASETFGDASTLTTTSTWYPLTFSETPIINEEIYLEMYYSGGDAANNVKLGFAQLDVKEGEYLSRWGAGTQEWEDFTDYDLAYKVEYETGRMRIEANVFAQIFLESK